MGMSIDKAIEHGKEQLEIFGGEHKEFIETAINTMRKYKKIEQILDDCDLEAWEVLEMIKEVVVDGNDTTNRR
jgi:hypothetical protein